MALTNKVIFINDVKQEDEKPVEFTGVLAPDRGLSNTTWTPKDYRKIVYLGKGSSGDMFACYHEDGIGIFIGHLNSGKY